MDIYLSNSPNDAATIPLVLTTTTSLVSPQNHLVFDDTFSATSCLHTNEISSNWPDLFKSSATTYLDIDQASTHKLHASWNDPTNASSNTCCSTVHFVDEVDWHQSTIDPPEPTILAQKSPPYNANPSTEESSPCPTSLVPFILGTYYP
jgi:hypothetical protein